MPRLEVVVLRVLSSWRSVAVGLAVVLAALVALAHSIEVQQRERAVREAVEEAQLVSELLLEVNLRPEDSHASALSDEVRERIAHGVELLQEEGRLVDLQLWSADGRLLFSDVDDPAPLGRSEQAVLPALRSGSSQAEFEPGAGGAVATGTVLLQPDNDLDLPSGLLAKILLPEDEMSASLEATTRLLYGGTALTVGLMALLAVLQRRRMTRRDHEATHDPLTGLGNRALLARAGDATLTASRGTGAGCSALLLLDLDGFKTVNDTLGHAVGDHLLVAVARALRAAVRPTDLVARLGGDEFAVLLRDLPGPDAALSAARQVSTGLHRPFVVDRVTLEVGASVGVAVAPEHGRRLEDLLRRADVAMYQAKREGGGVRLYDEADDPHDEEHLGLLSQLRSAIEDGELRLHYQPKLALREGRTVGFEALVRWQHPQRGLLGPGQFVPLAERTALMRPLTAWVLREAATRCARWRAEGWDVDVAVNIAPATLLDADFPARVMQLLADVGLPGDSLELEITETAVMVDPVRAAATLRRLRALGVAVSIDDFGAGYTSLSYLKSLPVHSLKIDRGFVTNLVADDKDAAVARSVVSLGHDLGLTVVAEGVETSEVRQRLLEMGCDEIQGYLLSRPMPSEDVEGWLREQRGAAGRVEPDRHAA